MMDVLSHDSDYCTLAAYQEPRSCQDLWQSTSKDFPACPANKMIKPKMLSQKCDGTMNSSPATGGFDFDKRV